MPSLNPVGADTRLLAQHGYPQGQCLHQCALALGAVPSQIGLVTTSRMAWDKSTSKHSGYPPLTGTPVIFSGAGGDWDTALWHGDGLVVGVDHPIPGMSGIQTVAQREAMVGGIYQGYLLDFLGWQIVGSQFADIGGTVVLPDLGDFDMYTIRNWQTGEISLWDGNKRKPFPLTVDIINICTVIQSLTGQPAATNPGGVGPWVNLSSAQIALLDQGLALLPDPVVTVPPITVPPASISPADIETGVRNAFSSAKTSSEGTITL